MPASQSALGNYYKDRMSTAYGTAVTSNQEHAINCYSTAMQAACQTDDVMRKGRMLMASGPMALRDNSTQPLLPCGN